MIGRLLNKFGLGSKARTQKSSEPKHRSDELYETVSRHYRRGDYPRNTSANIVRDIKRDTTSGNTSGSVNHRDSLVGVYPVVQITHPGLNLVHEYVLKSLVKPRADHEIVEIFNNFKWAPKVSDQHIRTSRNELVKLGLVEWSGEYRNTKNNVRAKVWQSTRSQEA